MSEPRPVLSRAVLDLAREAGDGALPPGEDRRARARFEEALTGVAPGRGTGRSFVRGWAPLFAAAALAVVLIAGAVSMRLRFTVSGATIADGNFVRAADAASATIAFSDGTRVDVEPRAAVRVADAGLRGADLVQERGRATYAVVHRPVAAWSVEAGPYRVRVTGTRFSVAWSPESGSFVAELYEGTVTIDGPSAGGGVRLRAGQRLRAAVPGAIVVEDITGATGATATPASTGDPPATSPSGPAEAPTPAIATSAPTAPVPSGSATSAPAASGAPDAAPSAAAAAPRSLAERLAQGESAAIADELEREGVAAFAARASAADLAIAADAARYAGKSALAGAALSALRSRHPGSREAALAAFHLGRAAESASPAAAAAWYDAYLNETGGGGALAIEARGRKMAVVARTAGNAAARPLAEAYLAQSPKGPHAALARSILASP